MVMEPVHQQITTLIRLRLLSAGQSFWVDIVIIMVSGETPLRVKIVIRIQSIFLQLAAMVITRIDRRIKSLIDGSALLSWFFSNG